MPKKTFEEPKLTKQGDATKITEVDEVFLVTAVWDQQT
jgi:hypothetical protein